jgi:uncharacterized BrkB/YihY/UPF0761 family membrane protein
MTVAKTAGEGVVQGIKGAGETFNIIGQALTDGETWGFMIQWFLAIGIPMALIYLLAWALINYLPEEPKKKKRTRRATR